MSAQDNVNSQQFGKAKKQKQSNVGGFPVPDSWSSKAEGYASCGDKGHHSAHEWSGGEKWCEGR